MVWTIVGAVAALLTTFGFVPQVVKMWRTGHVRDVSFLTLLQFLAGVSLWTAYAFHLADAVLLASNFVMLAILVMAVSSYLWLRRRHPPDGNGSRSDATGPQLARVYEPRPGADGHGRPAGPGSADRVQSPRADRRPW